MKHLHIFLPATLASCLFALCPPAAATDVTDPAATDIVLRIRYPAGQVNTHRQIVVDGQEVATIPVENFAGVQLREEAGNIYVALLYHIVPTEQPAAPTPPPDPLPLPPEPLEPPPAPPSPPEGYDLPPVLFEAAHTLADGSATWYATGENANAFRETLARLFDGDPATKWLAWQPDPILQINATAPITLTGLRLTSGNDQPSRDPATLRITTGDTLTEITLVVPPFTKRKQAQDIRLPNPITARRIRIEIQNRGDTRTQLAELEILTD